MIYIVSHKNAVLPRMRGYQPIQVGYSKENFPGYIRDNTGDNIAPKNDSFCELTALYWIWKNTDDDRKGLVHYRRFFGKNSLSNHMQDIYGTKKLDRMLERADIILPRKTVYHVNAQIQLCRTSCSQENFDKLARIVMDKYPEYKDTFCYFFSQNKVCQYNMLYCNRSLFDDYCTWLFDILFELENHIDVDALEGYSRRIFGFLSERLLNVWVLQQNLRVSYADVVQTENTLHDNMTLIRRNITNGIRYKLKKS